MSLKEIQNVVLLFSNPIWTGSNTVPTTIIRNLTALSSQIAYEASITQNITTLTTSNAEILDGVIQGLLYVPQIPADHPCAESQFEDPPGLPRNVTTKDHLPPRTSYKLIALAPWYSVDCTKAYLSAVRFDPIRAFIFYKPNHSPNKPQGVDSGQWDLEDDGNWELNNHFPIFAIPGNEGAKMARKLAEYSGSVEEVPWGQDIMDLYGPNPKDYVRIWTELSVKDERNLPAMWIFFVIVIGALLFIIACISAFLHTMQRGRRKRLRERVQSGEVDLEALGIARVVVPEDHIKTFPLFTYTFEPDRAGTPSTPISPMSPTSPKSLRSSRQVDRRISAVASTVGSRSRHSVTGAESTKATNFQPRCEICEEYFENRRSVIRQLPCFHIFHPECIDEFLAQNSSLCPVCRQCMLPSGYSPRVTNSMVRRERRIRSTRGILDVRDLESDDSKGREKWWSGRLWPVDVSVIRRRRKGTPGPSLQPSKPVKEKALPSGDVAKAAASMPATTATAPTAAAVSAAQDSTEISPIIPETSPDTSQPLDRTTSQSTTQSQVPPITPQTERARRNRPRGLKLQPPPSQGLVSAHQPGGRKSPSEAVRERMRELAARGQPVPLEPARPMWKRAMTKVFPGIL